MRVNEACIQLWRMSNDRAQLPANKKARPRRREAKWPDASLSPVSFDEAKFPWERVIGQEETRRKNKGAFYDGETLATINVAETYIYYGMCS